MSAAQRGKNSAVKALCAKRDPVEAQPFQFVGALVVKILRIGLEGDLGIIGDAVGIGERFEQPPQ